MKKVYVKMYRGEIWEVAPWNVGPSYHFASWVYLKPDLGLGLPASTAPVFGEAEDKWQFPPPF